MRYREVGYIQEEAIGNNYLRNLSILSGVVILIFITTSLAAYQQYLHLFQNDRHVFKVFAIWYGIGIVTEIIYLKINRYLFDLVLAPDYPQIFGSGIKAIAGPIDTVILLVRIRRGERSNS
jgi:hypothetical protein